MTPSQTTLPRFDDRDLQARRAYFEITDEDLQRLASLRPIAEKHTEEIVESFYALIRSHPDTRGFFADAATFERARAAQRKYFISLFSGRCDLDYVAERVSVGTTHERIGLAPRWYLGAYSRYLQGLHAILLREISVVSEAQAAFRSVLKLVYFDMSLAVDSYFMASIAALQRHQQAIRELSTPVIRVHDRILLLPLVGTVDSLRASQIMEAVLARVVEEQARVVILDIAGVAVVDTEVADHLLKTTAAVRLLGSDAIVTGISAQVARTVVQLGVDISTIHTRTRLAEGIELALAMIGKSITTKAGN